MAENDDVNEEMPDITENSGVNFQQKAVCLKIAPMPVPYVKMMLEHSRERLWKQKAFHEYCSREQLLEYVLEEVFFHPEGIPHTVYLVDLTIPTRDGGEDQRIGIRPQVLENSFLSRTLGPGKSLRFVGVPRGKEFHIGDIQIVQDDEQLPYEASAIILPYKDRNRVGSNFLYDMLDQTHSLVEHTAQKLQSWEDYLDWKQELSEKGLVGCRYFSIEQGWDQRDKERPEWNIGLIFESKEEFDRIRRELWKGMQVFDRDYSKNPWRFVYEYDSRARFRSWRLGRFHGVKSEGYADVMPREMSSEMREECPFSRPYIAWVRYELSEDDSEAMEDSDQAPEEFVNDELLPRLPEDGFLALSAVQDFTLIQRFRRAIGNLKRGMCDSPNLPLWLFDATEARLPRTEDFPEITEWLDPHIAENPSQREAVRKMLAAPDLCLIQGPPGTGKTTVIAEAIYQIVRQGKRVLLASQSNDAVDNALERLQKDPTIRAVRMANNARMRKEGGSRYTADTILTEYYQSLAHKTEETWLGLWRARDEELRTCQKDYRDAMNYEEDLRALEKASTQAEDALHENEIRIQEARAKLRQAEEENAELRTAGQQFDFLARDVEAQQDDDFLLLSQDLLQTMRPIAQQLTETFRTQGLFPELPDFEAQDIERVTSGKLAYLLRCSHQIPFLLEKARQAAGSGTVDSLELKTIELRLEENERQMDALPEDDDEGFRRLRKEAKALKKRREELQKQSGNLSDRFTERERKMFSSVLQQAMGTPEGGVRVQDALRQAKEASDKTWPQIIAAGRSWLAAHPARDLSELHDGVTIAENRGRTLLDTRQSLQQQQQEKEQTLATLRERYGAQDDSQASVAHSIRNRQEQVEKQQEEDTIRPVWEPILQEYHDRLMQKEAGAEDREIYQRTYLDACNVVGTSCTANMRDFEEHGFEDFDVAIIDEVSKATPPELLLPLTKARKAILVGDHRQLPPMFGESETSYEALMNRAKDHEAEQEDAAGGDAEDFEEDEAGGNAAQATLLTPENFHRYHKMVTASLFKEFFETADDAIKQRLQVQFRMHGEIMQVINRFYENQLQAGLTAEQEAEQRDHGLTLLDLHQRPFLTPEHHAYWMDSYRLPDGTPIYESWRGGSTSACNLLEQRMILRLVQRMAQACKEKKLRKTLGIISFYQAQINDLRKAIKTMVANKTLDLSYLQLRHSDINTVDRFQGKEKNIIIVSMVRSKKSHRLGEHTLEFERINVAFSRAQQLLVIVGSQELFADQQITMPAMDTKGTITANVYGNIVEYLRSLGTSLDASCVLTEEDCAFIRKETRTLAEERKAWEGKRK